MPTIPKIETQVVPFVLPLTISWNTECSCSGATVINNNDDSCIKSCILINTFKSVSEINNQMKSCDSYQIITTSINDTSSLPGCLLIYQSDDNVVNPIHTLDIMKNDTGVQIHFTTNLVENTPEITWFVTNDLGNYTAFTTKADGKMYNDYYLTNFSFKGIIYFGITSMA